jgi:hypothetical protein
MGAILKFNENFGAMGDIFSSALAENLRETVSFMSDLWRNRIGEWSIRKSEHRDRARRASRQGGRINPVADVWPAGGPHPRNKVRALDEKLSLGFDGADAVGPCGGSG